jgi:carbon-monoxide dehydrogenase iron sulfur subunit
MKRLSVRLERCTGCQRCEIGCMAEHAPGQDYYTARAAAAAAKAPAPITRILVESGGDGRAVPLVCRHCHEALCVSACMSGCMQKDPKTGIVTNMGHEQQCVGCWMCIMACPYGVITPSQDVAVIGGSPFAQAIKCDFCPQRDTPACVEVCPNNAIEVLDD